MKDYEEIMNSAKYNIAIQIDRAYQQGYEDGKKALCDCKDSMEAEYNRGLNEAWEVIQNIANDDTKGGYSYKMMMDIFGVYRIYDIVQKYAPQDVIRMIKEYEEQQVQDIQVGDEVVLNGNASYENEKAIILAYDGLSYPYNVLMDNGDSEWVKEEAIERKTGRHFDAIAEVLEKMRGDKE